LSRDGKGKYGWEEVPYWLRGYIQLAYIFNDPKMIAEARSGSMERSTASVPTVIWARPEVRRRFARFLGQHADAFCLETYYEHSHDARVLEVMTKYFKYHLTIPDHQLLTHYWQKMRGGDELYSIYWLYNRTGDPDLLKLAGKIHRVTADWEKPGDLPDWHNVNNAECFREPATYYLQTHRQSDLQASYADFTEVRKRYGQVPGGMFGGDEVCRPVFRSAPGGRDLRHGWNKCCRMNCSCNQRRPVLGGQLRERGVQHLSGGAHFRQRALRYLTAPNLVVSDAKNHAPGIKQRGAVPVDEPVQFALLPA